MYMSHSKVTSGFTLIELFVVITIISLLVAMLLPAVSIVRDAARKTACGSNLRQIGLCMTHYLDDNSGVIFPRDASNYFQPLEHNLMPYFDGVDAINNCVVRGSTGQTQYGTNDRLNLKAVGAISSPSTRIVIADSLTSACYDYCSPSDLRIDYRHRSYVGILFLDMHVGSARKVPLAQEAVF